MSSLTHLSLVDVVIAAVIIAAAAGSLRRGGGVLAAVGSAALAALACWLVAAALVAWAPGRPAAAVERSDLLHMLPLPDRALAEVGRLTTPMPERGGSGLRDSADAPSAVPGQ